MLTGCRHKLRTKSIHRDGVTIIKFNGESKWLLLCLPKWHSNVLVQTHQNISM